MKNKIDTTNAPAAIGPYSQAIEHNGTVYVSGQLPIDPATGAFPDDTIERQTRQSLENIKAILAEVGLGMDSVLKTTVLLKSIADFDKMNEVYSTYFDGIYPARAAFQVGALPKGALVEIEVVAGK